MKNISTRTVDGVPPGGDLDITDPDEAWLRARQGVVAWSDVIPPRDKDEDEPKPRQRKRTATKTRSTEAD